MEHLDYAEQLDAGAASRLQRLGCTMHRTDFLQCMSFTVPILCLHQQFCKEELLRRCPSLPGPPCHICTAGAKYQAAAAVIATAERILIEVARSPMHSFAFAWRVSRYLVTQCQHERQ